MNLIQLTGALELGLIYSIVAMGIYLSFRILQFPDMTVDGSFPLGAAICAACILCGMHPLAATFVAMLGGALSGYMTALMATRLKMLNLLAGILTMIALYSINLRIMGRPNMAISGEKTIFSEYFSAFAIPGVSTLLVPLLILVTLVGLTALFFLRTELGLGLRAAGSNPKMARAKGINDQSMIQLGLSISNSFVALAGALFAQTQGFADVNMGTGTIVYGLAAVILGEALLPIRNLKQALVACVVGAILYRFVLSLALNTHDLGLQASDLNLITALIMVVAMQVPEIKRRLKAIA